jgi:hypothetical protein
MFHTLHLMFEQQYNELALAVDLIAERIRALGCPAPGSYKQFAALTSLKEEDGVPSAEDMIRILVKDQEAVVRTARSIFPVVDAAHDEPTRSADPAHAGARKDRLDVAQPARLKAAWRRRTFGAARVAWVVLVPPRSAAAVRRALQPNIRPQS